MSDIAAIILAAGKGTRFRFQSKDVNKVTLSLAGKPIILYSVELLEQLGMTTFVVVGFAKDSVVKALSGHAVRFVDQEEQQGTANAIAQALPHVSAEIKHVLVLNGDDPFHKEGTIKKLIALHSESAAAITFTTSELENPSGMGRIVRDEKGNVCAIVEEKDVTEEQRKIREVNGACYLFRLDFLKTYLPKLVKSKITGEYYLTDFIALAVQHNEKVETILVEGKWKGINSSEDLEDAEKLI